MERAGILDRRAWWSLALGTGAAYALAAEASWRWFGAGSAGLAFFPAAGVSFAALVLSRRRVWPALVLTVALAELTIDVAHGLSLQSSLGWATANALEPLVGASCVRAATAGRVFRRLQLGAGTPSAPSALRIDLRDRAGLGWFVLGGVLAGPAAGSLVAATVRTASRGGWWENAAHWIAGDGLGVLAVGAPLVIALDGRRGRVRGGELALVTALAAVVGFLSFTTWTAPPTFAVLPVLVWAATRLGVDGVATTGFVLCVMANHATASDRGPFARLDWYSPQVRIGLTQLFLTVSVLTGWFLAVEVGTRLTAVARGEAEAAERRRAEVARDVGGLAASLTGAATMGDICATVTRHVRRRLGPSATLVVLADPASGRLVPVTVAPTPPGALDEVGTWDARADAPGPEALRTGDLVHVPDAAALAERYPHLTRLVDQADVGAVTAVPLPPRPGIEGYLSIFRAGPADLDPDDRRFLEDVARTVSDALRQARSFEAEREARQAAELAQLELRREARARELLARISEVVAAAPGGPDPRAVLRSLAEAAVPEFADACSFRLLEDGFLVTASLAAADAELRAELEAAVSGPLDPTGTSPVAEAFRTGSPVLVEVVSDGDIDRVFEDAAHRLALRRHRLHTLLCVPLPHGRDTSGVVAFAHRGDRPEPLDVDMAEEFVRRCAALVDEVLLREQATASRHDAEQAAARAELVATITDALAHAHDAEQIRRTVHGVLPGAVGATSVDVLVAPPGAGSTVPAPGPGVEVVALVGAERHPLGWLAVTWPPDHVHDAATALLIDTVADIAAQAVERTAARRQEIRQRRRSEAFATLASELAAAATVDQVLHVAGNCSLALFDADVCAVLRRTDQFGGLRLLFARGLDAERLALWSSLDLAAPSAPARAARHACLVVEEPTGDHRGGSLGAVPIEVAGSALGAMVVELRPGHDFDQSDRRLLLSVAAVVSQAAERAAGFETQAARRALAERAQQANASLAAASGTEEVLAALFGCVLELLEADEVVIVLRDTPRVWWRTAGGDVHDGTAALPQHVERWVHAPDSPAGRAVGLDRATIVRARSRLDAEVRGPSVAPALAVAAIPLRLGPGHDVGTVHVVFGVHRRLDEVLDETCRSLQDQWTDALRRARAFDLELAAVARLQVLQRITAALGAARTTDDVVHVIEASAGHLGAARATVELGDGGVPGAPPLGSIALPLSTRQGPVGRLVLDLAGGEPPHPSLVETLADLCAQALDRTRSSDFEHNVAVELQRAMLGSPDAVQRLAVGSSYRPSEHALDVGGDWYDVIRLGSDEAVLVVGDVVGHSLGAAAAMGQLRSAARALAPIVADPAELLTRLDGFVDGLPAARYTTMCAVTVGEGGGFRYASAGHPPAVLVHADGTTELLDAGRSAPLGLGGGSRPSDGGGLRPDDVLVLYTDGLVERRDASLDAGIERLRAHAASRRHLPPGELAEVLVDAMLEGRAQGDDIAVLVAKLVSASFRHELGPDPRGLRELRARARTWLSAHEGDAEAVDELLLGVHEVAADAVQHAAADPARRPVVVTARVDATGVIAEVVDHGPRAERTDPADAVDLLRSVVDAVEIDQRRDGRSVRLRKSVRRAPAGLPR